MNTLTAALGSRIRRHGQPGGEENLVLEGVFHDELGSYRAGSWLRNPPDSVHRPPAGNTRSKWISCLSNNQVRDTRQFLNCLSPQWRNALIATGSLMTSGQHAATNTNAQGWIG